MDTLGNERVSMAAGSSFGRGEEASFNGCSCVYTDEPTSCTSLTDTFDHTLW